MPTKNNRRGNKTQAALNKTIRDREREFKKAQKEWNKKRLAEKKKQDKELVKFLNTIRGKGLYEPKSNELTPYRRRKIREIKKSAGEYLNAEKYFFIPAGKEAKKRVLERAKSLQMETTKTGFFFPRQGHKTASLKIDKKHNEFFIERKGKTKTGPTKGRVYKSIIPLTSVDELDRERERIRRLAEKIKLTADSDRLVFKVVENGGEGYSHATFTNVELLMKYLDGYQKKTAAKVNFFRHVVVEKSSVNEWFARHEPRSPGRAGRRNKYDTRGSKG